MICIKLKFVSNKQNELQQKKKARNFNQVQHQATGAIFFLTYTIMASSYVVGLLLIFVYTTTSGVLLFKV